MSDPFYGKVPKKGKGIVISNPLEISGRSIRIKSSDLDPIELRRAVLFWDRISWPRSRIISIGGSGPEVGFLESAGILTRPITPLIYGDGASNFALMHVEEYFRSEREEPGLWVMSEGESAFSWAHPRIDQTRGALVTLYRSIPIPSGEVPLEDVLEFKMKRRDELVGLKLKIDDFYSKVVNSRDHEFELQRHIGEIELACADVLKAARASTLTFRLSDFKLGFSANIGSIASVPAFATAGALFGQGYALPVLGAIVGGALPLIGLSTGISIKGREQNRSPFSVVGSLHKEIIGH